jgi:hypothetical protein
MVTESMPSLTVGLPPLDANPVHPIETSSKFQRLCVFAPWRAIGFHIQAAILARAQRRKGHKGETPREITTTAMTNGKCNMANGK